MVAFSDQLTVFIKNATERLRPCSDPTINIRDVLNRKSFSFVSGHATTSSAVSLLMFLTLKKYYKYTILFFIWPLLFAYSRIYVGVHFPGDVIIGAMLGLTIGFVFYQISLKVLAKVDAKKE
jgi:undecaprenyl-diphosphatase